MEENGKLVSFIYADRRLSQKKMKLVSISAISADTNCLHPTVSGQGRIITVHVMRWEVSRISQTAMERY